MLASAPAVSAPSPDRSPAPAAPSLPANASALAERRCPYCCAGLAREAKKCRACGEWVVRTSAGAAAALLRLLAWLWVGLSLLAAAGLWSAGTAVRLRVLTRAVDPVVTPLVLDVVLYGLVAILLLQGLAVGATLGVLAGLAPRRPRWWT